MATARVEVETVIRGHHVYKEIWTPTLGEVLTCRRETDNFHDRFAVVVMKGTDLVGHVPRKISTICSLFLRSGAVRCEVIGSRQYSADLDQGGLEVPCKLIFACSDQELLFTTRKLLYLALKKEDYEMPLKRIKLEQIETPDITVDNTMGDVTSVKVIDDGQDQEYSSSGLNLKSKDLDSEWVKTGRISLLTSHKTKILNGSELDDAIMNFAQRLLKKQFPDVNGLQNTLLQAKKQVDAGGLQRLQVIHSRGNHWIIASTVHDEGPNKVMIYDSLYDNIDAGTRSIISDLFGSAAMPEIVKVHKQQGVKDCGLFAVAIATAICFKQELAVPFNQEIMREHLVQCFEKGVCLPFPFVHNT